MALPDDLQKLKADEQKAASWLGQHPKVKWALIGFVIGLIPFFLKSCL